MTERGAAAAPPAGMAVTEHQLAQALESLLREPNAFTTVADVVEQLESKLGVNLIHKIDFIRTQIHHFHLLQSQHQNFMPHYQQQFKDHFAINQNPNFPPTSPAHLPPNFAAHHLAQDYGFRPPPPPSLQPQPHTQPQPQPQPQPSLSPPSDPATAVNTPSTASAGVQI